MRTLTLLLLVLFLAACQPTTVSITDDYQSRLARVLDADNPNQLASELPAFPRQAELAVNVDSVRLDVLDAWSLRECGLLPFIGERNSVLGQVMPPSRALDYELRLLAQLESCVDQPDVDQALIAEIVSQKQAQLPARIWNATLASEEFRQFWRRGQGPVGADQALPVADLTKVLSDWQQLIKNPSPDTLQIERFERNNQVLYQMNVGSSWLRSVLHANAALTNGNALLQQAIAKPMCPRGTIAQARYAQNVMVNYYVGELQPHFAMLNRFGERLVNDVQVVHKQLAVDNPDMQQFIDLLTDTHRDFHSLNQQHVGYWQQLMNSCDLSIANSQ